MRRDEQGSLTLEMVVLAPGLLIFIGVVIFAGRYALAGQAVQQAAEDASRQASISRTESAARSAAEGSARATLSSQGLDCQGGPTIDLNTNGFSVPVGQPASVSATVTCRVSAGDLLVPGLPGSRTVTETSTSALDTFRGR